MLVCIGFVVGARIDRDRLARLGAACPVVVPDGRGLGVVVRSIRLEDKCPFALLERGVVVDLAVAALEHERAADPAARGAQPAVQRVVLSIGRKGGQVAPHAVVCVGLGSVIGRRPRELLVDIHVAMPIDHLGDGRGFRRQRRAVGTHGDLDLGGLVAAAKSKVVPQMLLYIAGIFDLEYHAGICGVPGTLRTRNRARPGHRDGKSRRFDL